MKKRAERIGERVEVRTEMEDSRKKNSSEASEVELN